MMQRFRAVLAALLLAPLGGLHAAEVRVFDITAYGAKSDGQTINTSAIQKAIDACHAAGGGTVLVPEGAFVTGSLRLKSRVTLEIAKNAILRGSPTIAHYTVETAELHWGAFWEFAASQWRQCLIYAENAEEIGIEGPGTIDGQGGSEQGVPERQRPASPHAGAAGGLPEGDRSRCQVARSRVVHDLLRAQRGHPHRASHDPEPEFPEWRRPRLRRVQARLHPGLRHRFRR